MSLSLFLPWFPIVLAVGVGGRLLGGRRGLALGVICAFFWIVLVQASAGTRFWLDGWGVASVLAGAFTIAAMGAWAGDHSLVEIDSAAGYSPIAMQDTAAQQLSLIGSTFDRFDGWLEEHRNDTDPWAAFGEFIRATLHHCCQATHVQPYRVSCDGSELVALRAANAMDAGSPISARDGLVGHVVSTGRAYVSGDPAQGKLVQVLANGLNEPTEWCFAISRGTQRLGVVVVGRLNQGSVQMIPLMAVLQQMMSQFWRTLEDALRSRTAEQIEPVSGVLTLRAFLETADRLVEESNHAGEPVAAVVISLEGLRSLSDTGRWETADELIREISIQLRRKTRVEDRLGRLDGSRFILLLRRVDSALASLIVRQIVARLSVICGDVARWRSPIHVRCGLAGSSAEKPESRALIARAMEEAQRARVEHLAIAGDVAPALTPELETAR